MTFRISTIFQQFKNYFSSIKLYKAHNINLSFNIENIILDRYIFIIMTFITSTIFQQFRHYFSSIKLYKAYNINLSFNIENIILESLKSIYIYYNDI